MDKLNTNYYFFKSDNNNSKKKISDKKNERVEKKSFFNTLIDENKSFEEIDNLKNEHTDTLKEEISVLLKDIGQQGKRLKQNRTIADLDKYKKLVKSFLTKVISVSEDISVKTIYNTKRKEKISKLHLSIIDNELLQLTKIFIEEQASVIKIASQIDKIEGIILDMAY